MSDYNYIENDNNNDVNGDKLLLPTPDSMKGIDRKDIEEVFESVMMPWNNNKHDNNIHTLGASFWRGTNETNDYNTAQQDDDDNKKPKQQIIVKDKQQQSVTRRIITPAAPGLGLFNNNNNSNHNNNHNTTNNKMKRNGTCIKISAVAGVVAAKNLHQVISSGRILDRDTLRESQIKQNEDHQKANRLRPWNNANQFLP